MTTSESNALRPDGAPSASRRSWLRAAIPHIVTAVIAIIASFGLQSAFFRPTPPSSFPPAPTSALPTPTSAPTPVPATQIPLAPDIARQEIEDVRADIAHIWMANYLYRAAIQIDDANQSLEINELQNVEQLLFAVDESLSLAYSQADDATKDPISQLRQEIDGMRNDLFLRPEGMDRRLDDLRRRLLVLIDAPR